MSEQIGSGQGAAVVVVPQAQGTQTEIAREISAEVRAEMRQAAREAREAAREAREMQLDAAQAAGHAGHPVPVAPVAPIPPDRAIVLEPDGPGGDRITIHPAVPEEAMLLALAILAAVVLMVIGWPVSRAIARRMDRKPLEAPASPEVLARLGRIEQSVDAIALEVERISEAQRFSARLLAERGDGALRG